GNIWKNFTINLEDPTPFFTNDTLDSIIPGLNEPSKYQINNYLAPIVDKLVDFASGIDLPATFEYKKVCKIYVTLILSSNDVPATRKICGYISYTVKYHCCLKHAIYDNLSKRSHYSNFENIDEWFNLVDITKYFDVAKEKLNCINKQERDDH
ncbi:4528_t:CDS:2, partial [Scutellospora calospora]